MGEAPSGAALAADVGIMRTAAGSASSLKEMYFLNRFPEKEEKDRLLEGEESSSGENDNIQVSSSTPEQRNDVGSPEGMSASEEFSVYMQSKRSKAQGGSADDRVKQLQDKLKNLQSQLSPVTSRNESHGAGNKEIENIQSQISTTVAELAEASAQAAAEKSEASANK